jgi:hypothetical protein
MQNQKILPFIYQKKVLDINLTLSYLEGRFLKLLQPERLLEEEVGRGRGKRIHRIGIPAFFTRLARTTGTWHFMYMHKHLQIYNAAWLRQ